MAYALSSMRSIVCSTPLAARPTASSASQRSAVVVRAQANDSKFSAITKTLQNGAALGAAALLLSAGPSYAFKFDLSGVLNKSGAEGYPAVSTENGGKLDTSTELKKDKSATIEFSDISNESPASVVQKLKDEILPSVTRALDRAASGDGSTYTDSVVQELKTVKKEIEALQKQVDSGSNPSNVKSLASSIEQQINALKAILNFD